MEHLPIELAEHIADNLHAYSPQPFGRWSVHTSESRRDIQVFRQVCKGFDHASAKAFAKTVSERSFRLNSNGLQQLLDLARKPGLAPYINSLTFADELCYHVDAAKVFEAASNLTTVVGQSDTGSVPTMTLEEQQKKVEELRTVYNRQLMAQEADLKDGKIQGDLTEAFKSFPNLSCLRIVPEVLDGTLKRLFTAEQYQFIHKIAEHPDMPSMSLFPGGHRPDTLPSLLQAVVDANVVLKEFTSSNNPTSETLQVIRLDLPRPLLTQAFRSLRTMRITADSQRAYPSEPVANPDALAVRRDALANFISCAPHLETLDLDAGGSIWEHGVERRSFALRPFLTEVRLPRLKRFALQGPVLLDNAYEFQELQQFLDAHRATLEVLALHEVQTRSSAVAVHCAYCVWTDFVVWLKGFPHLEVEVKGTVGSEEFTEMLFSEPLGWIRRVVE